MNFSGVTGYNSNYTYVYSALDYTNTVSGTVTVATSAPYWKYAGDASNPADVVAEYTIKVKADGLSAVTIKVTIKAGTAESTQVTTVAVV